MCTDSNSHKRSRWYSNANSISQSPVLAFPFYISMKETHAAQSFCSVCSTVNISMIKCCQNHVLTYITTIRSSFKVVKQVRNNKKLFKFKNMISRSWCYSKSSIFWRCLNWASLVWSSSLVCKIYKHSFLTLFCLSFFN